MEHGSTRGVVDGSLVCAEAGAYTAAARHDYSDPWEDDELPSEQPWHRQLRRGNDGCGEYDEQSGYDPSEYDDNDVTLGGEAHPAKEQQWSATLMGNSYVKRSGIGRLLWRVTSMSQRSSKDQALWWAITSQRSGDEEQ